MSLKVGFSMAWKRAMAQNDNMNYEQKKFILHFCLPEHFNIYDSGANKAISKLAKPIGRTFPWPRAHDDICARFFLRCKALSKDAASTDEQHLLARELDKVLLADTRSCH